MVHSFFLIFIPLKFPTQYSAVLFIVAVGKVEGVRILRKHEYILQFKYI